MKTRNLKIVSIATFLLFGFITTKGQDNIKKTENPYPLSETRKKEVLESCGNIIRFYSNKFGTKHLDQWPKAERDSFLIAKAKKINVLFVSEYYREYDTSPSIEAINAPDNHPIYPGALIYKVTFYVDTLKEKLVSARLFYADIWNTGEAKGFIVPVYENSGDFFRPPLWEDGKYQDWQKRNFHPFSYITGYENIPTETLNQMFKRKQQEQRAKNKK